MENLGILLPIQRGLNGYFDQGRTINDQIRSNLQNLLLTRKGERLLLPTFGCNIHSYIFDEITPEVYANIKSSITEAVSEWMPFVQIDNIEINKLLNDELTVNITYTIELTIGITDSITLIF